jgi:hypothetical protein
MRKSPYNTGVSLCAKCFPPNPYGTISTLQLNDTVNNHRRTRGFSLIRFCVLFGKKRVTNSGDLGQHFRHTRGFAHPALAVEKPVVTASQR